MKRWPRALSFSLLLVVATLCAVWLMRSCARLPGEAAEAAREPALALARRIADGVSRRLQFRPEVRIDRTTVLEPRAPVLELASVRREFLHEYSWEQQWLGSTKRLRLRGTFAAKAGFDLNEDFFIGIDSRDLRVEIGLPRARLLGVEMLRYEAEEEEGFWNKLSAAERAQAVNALLASARAAAAAGLTEEARRMLEAQLGEAVTEAGGRMREPAAAR